MTDTIGARSDAGNVLMGCPRRGPEVVESYPHDGEAVPPGVAGCLNTDGEFVAGAAAPLLGISRGQDLCHADRNAVTLSGSEVPLQLTDLGAAASLVVGDLTFTAVDPGEDGNAITITLANSKDDASAEVTVEGTDIVIAMETAATTAQTIATAIEESEAASALVTVEVADGEGSTAQTAAAKDNLEGGSNSFDYVTPGTAVYIDDTTGLATADGEGATISNWTYDSAPLTGISPTVGEESVPAALVNM